ncbi:MAG: tetratricopeptide repeat protein [Limnothrix sp. RL_2_0]|nr:tetratricopeptide repeat protein [Limnothrix sp. RL_2_0]
MLAGLAIAFGMSMWKKVRFTVGGRTTIRQTHSPPISMAAEQDKNNSPDIDQSQSDLGIGAMQGGNIRDNARVAGEYNDNSTTININGVPEEALLKALENTGKSDGIGILRTGDPAKTTKHWQGREKELETLIGWLNNRNVSLLGIEAIGGMGKSTLAAKLYESDDLTFTKCYWADVTNGATFAEVARKILTKFGFAIPEQEQALGQALVQCLRQGNFLLIIDNLESLLTEERQWTGQFWQDFFLGWQEYGGNSKILVTSRERPTEPLFDKWLNLKGLAKEAGAELLAAKGIQGDREAFCELVDGHPLLLTIVADFLKSEFPDPELPPRLDYLERLGLGNLRELMTKAEGQHRKETVGLAVVLDATFQRLSEVQQKIFLAVSVLRQRFNTKMAKAVAGVELDEKVVEKELRQIVNKSLLGERRDKETLERWYEFQPVVREYANYRAGKNQQAHQNAITFYEEQANADKTSWQTVADVQEYLEIAHHWLAIDEIDQAFAMVRRCDEFLTLRGYYTTLIEVYTPIITAYEQLDHPEKHWQYGAALTDVGLANNSLGQYQQAIQIYQKRLDIAISNNDKSGQAACFGNLGNAYRSLGEYQRAIAFHQQHLDIAREIGDQWGIGTALGNLGIAYIHLEKYQEAEANLLLVLELFQELGARDPEAEVFYHLADIAFRQNQFQTALEYVEQSHAIATELFIPRVQECEDLKQKIKAKM